MNQVIENINNPEPKFMLHDEMIHWMQQNMRVHLHVGKEYIRDLTLPDGSIMSADTEFVNIAVSINLNHQDVSSSDVFPKTIQSNTVKLLIPKNDLAQYGGATQREQRIYDDMNKMAIRMNNLLNELAQLKGTLQHIQYPLPEDIK